MTDERTRSKGVGGRGSFSTRTIVLGDGSRAQIVTCVISITRLATVEDELIERMRAVLKKGKEALAESRRIMAEIKKGP